MALKGFLLAWIALGSAAHLRDLEIFEIDPATQAFEIQRIKDRGISLPPSVQYISAYPRRCSRERWCSGKTGALPAPFETRNGKFGIRIGIGWAWNAWS
jgi:hypothetical protein